MTVLHAIREADLCTKAENCCFGYHELKLLRHVVSVAGVRLDPEKTLGVENFSKKQT